MSRYDTDFIYWSVEPKIKVLVRIKFMVMDMVAVISMDRSMVKVMERVMELVRGKE